MTIKELYDFSKGQIAWYTKENEFCKRQIAWYNRQLARTRKEDREMKEYAIASRPGDEVIMRIYGGQYVGNETRKYINERARYYREVKSNQKMIERYTAECERYLKML